MEKKIENEMEAGVIGFSEKSSPGACFSSGLGSGALDLWA